MDREIMHKSKSIHQHLDALLKFHEFLSAVGQIQHFLFYVRPSVYEDGVYSCLLFYYNHFK